MVGARLLVTHDLGQAGGIEQVAAGGHGGGRARRPSPPSACRVRGGKATAGLRAERHGEKHVAVAEVCGGH